MMPALANTKIYQLEASLNGDGAVPLTEIEAPIVLPSLAESVRDLVVYRDIGFCEYPANPLGDSLTRLCVHVHDRDLPSTCR